MGFLWYSLLRGGLRTRHLGEVSTFGDGATLDVPGSPVVTLTPGHTSGSAVLHFRSLGALLIGDAFATYAVTTGLGSAHRSVHRRRRTGGRVAGADRACVVGHRAPRTRRSLDRRRGGSRSARESAASNVQG